MATPPSDFQRPAGWFYWGNLLRLGMDVAPRWQFTWITSALLRHAAGLEAAAAKRRSHRFVAWARAQAPGEATLFQWLRERPPFVPAPAGEGLKAKGYQQVAKSKAAV